MTVRTPRNPCAPTSSVADTYIAELYLAAWVYNTNSSTLASWLSERVLAWSLSDDYSWICLNPNGVGHSL